MEYNIETEKGKFLFIMYKLMERGENMKLRMPAYPLITIDPYFSIWSSNNTLNCNPTLHWTGKPNEIIGILKTDEARLLFMGVDDSAIPMKQVMLEVTALSTTYTFKYNDIILKAVFTSPLLSDDIDILSRPVSYLSVEVEGVENAELIITASESLCLSEAGQHPVETEIIDAGFPLIKMGSKVQNVLGSFGDDIRIDYGYLYLGVNSRNGTVFENRDDTGTYIGCKAAAGEELLFVFGYDDIYSIEYFGEKCCGAWKHNGATLISELENAVKDYRVIKARCDKFDQELYSMANECGGKYYAELLSASYRQVMAAHKAVIDKDGKLLWISKECSSNGCAATVDVSYPSSPIFMLYNTELLKGMLRPIFRYAESDMWRYDFAPHDVGTYPILNGQTYYDCKIEYQMPIEECGNMLIMSSALAILEGNSDFLNEYRKTLDTWADYLLRSGFDPDNQLCTDDFAGYMAHNCNLSLKTICALAAYGKACAKVLGEEDKYGRAAKEMAEKWIKAAANGDGSYKLAFDRQGTFSMKYNLIWDKVMKLGLFDSEVAHNEAESYKKHFEKYGMPLDNRAVYTKSDWLVWCAALTDNKPDFEEFIKPLWNAYNETLSRVPMTDWYDTDTALQRCFKNRTVLGGFWIKLLDSKNLF